MNWIAFFILTYVTVALQSGAAPLLRPPYGSAEPNLGLLALVFITINAPRDPALLGAFFLGLMQDLATRQPVGLFAFSYGLSALAIRAVGRNVYREHPLTHVFCTLLAGGVTTVVLLIHARWRGPAASPIATAMGTLYTALLAPLVIGGLQYVKEWFGFVPKRNR